jgi:hypothetical protein
MQWSYCELRRLTFNGFLGGEIVSMGDGIFCWMYLQYRTSVSVTCSHVSGSTMLSRFESKYLALRNRNTDIPQEFHSR